MKFEYAIYGAFTEQSFSGSPAAIVADASELSATQMQQIAKEFKAPATGFIEHVDTNEVSVRFFSTQTEYPMCGHGTIALISWLIERNKLAFSSTSPNHYVLKTPYGKASLTARLIGSGRVRVMLELAPASFEIQQLAPELLAELCGIQPSNISTALPVALTRSDFVHLMVPVTNINCFKHMSPNFVAIESYCRERGVDTMMFFTEETISSAHTVHAREFCPAVGTPEAPASGTTNRALGCYLMEFEALHHSDEEVQQIVTEQGYEMGRPSQIETQLILKDGVVQLCRVGGISTKVMQGELFL